MSIATPATRRPPETHRTDSHRGRARAQPAQPRRRDSARAVRRRHRRVGVGQVDADRGHSASRARAALLSRARHSRRAHAHHRLRAHRQGDRHRPESDRPHAALESGDVHGPVHADSRAVRRAARGEDSRLRAGALLVQREGRPLRGVSGRRSREDRDAFPARRLRALRGVQGQALQSRDARGSLPRAEHLRRARA